MENVVIVLGIACACLVLPGALGVVIFILVRANRGGPETKAAWEEAARLTGLAVQHRRLGYSRLDGTFGDRAATVRVNPGPRNNPLRTSYRVSHNRQGVPDLTVFRKVPLGGLAAGAKTQIGVPEFDRDFTIVCDQPEFARAVLADAGLRERLMQVDDATAAVRAETVAILERSVQRDPVVMQDRLKLAHDLAEQVEKT